MSNNAPAVLPIPNFYGLYSVTSDGHVIRHRRVISDRRCGWRILTERFLKPCNVAGYLYITLTDTAGMHSRFAVHRLIATCFHGHPRVAGLDVNHKDCVKNNNAATNLEWVTRSENQLHAANHGLKPVGDKSHFAKLNARQVLEIRDLIAANKPRSAIAAQFSVTTACIGKIARGEKWKQLSAV